MQNEIIIIGTFKEIIELAEKNDYKIIGLISNTNIGTSNNYKILCNDQDIKIIYKEFIKYPILITPDKPERRYNLFKYYNELGFAFASVISKDARISEYAMLDMGVIVQYGVNISCEVKIGKFARLNTYCNIMHNVIIGDFTTIAPNAVILGNVKIGNNCYIGANSTILPNLEIGNNVIIGAGAVVTKIVDDNKVVAGNPARELKII